MIGRRHCKVSGGSDDHRRSVSRDQQVSRRNRCCIPLSRRHARGELVIGEVEAPTREEVIRRIEYLGHMTIEVARDRHAVRAAARLPARRHDLAK